eukprot:5839208-Pleurochrysis_carterae.AAC.1
MMRRIHDAMIEDTEHDREQVAAQSEFFDDKTMGWMQMLKRVENFIEERGEQQRPSRKSKDENEKRLAVWINNQQTYYAKNAHIMKNVVMRQEW